MNREDIIRMAQEAQMPFYWRTGEITYLDKLERFAALVASHALVEPCCGNYDRCQKVCMPRAAFAEREACEALHDHEDVQAPIGNSSWGEAYQEGWGQGTAAYLEAIKARGDKHD